MLTSWLFSRQYLLDGVDFGDTKALFNVGFTILNPTDKISFITKTVNGILKYAEAEWQWYLSGDPSIEKAW
jgi:hypothetical protein